MELTTIATVEMTSIERGSADGFAMIHGNMDEAKMRVENAIKAALNKEFLLDDINVRVQFFLNDEKENRNEAES